jgi:heme exporter protein A
MQSRPAPSGDQRAAVTTAGPLVEVEGLERTFGHRRALAGVDFEVGSGECLALFGPNGAGKTTLLRVLAGLLKPTAGRARIAGVQLPAGAVARALVGLISHNSMLYEALTARENVAFVARLYGLSDPQAAAETALRRMRIDDRAETPVRALSRGMQQRVSIARAVVHSPRVLLLDEPYSGLDEAGAAALTTLLGDLRSGGAALVIVTHNLAEGLALATQSAIMRGGRFAHHEPQQVTDPATYAARYRELVASGP